MNSVGQEEQELVGKGAYCSGKGRRLQITLKLLTPFSGPQRWKRSGLTSVHEVHKAGAHAVPVLLAKADQR